MPQEQVNAEDGTLPAEQPKVTAATKFRKGGFKPAAEVIAEAEAAAGKPAEEQADDPDMAAAIALDAGMNYESQEGVAPLAGAAETIPPAPENTELQPEPKFKIGGKEFATQEEAWAYAEELERKQDVADAFRQGVEAAAIASPGNPAAQPEVPELPKEIDPLYYTDPQAYFAKREAEILARAEARIEEKLKRKETHNSVWTQFYQDYPDLANDRDLVDMFLQRDWGTLQHIETKAALKQLATTVRTRLGKTAESRMPKVVLPKVTTTASPGGAAGVTPTTQPKPVLNFAQQIKQAKKGKGAVR